jgi:hypothetical protein
MLKNLLPAFLTLTLLVGVAATEPAEKSTPEKKKLVKPPFPDGDPKEPLLPPQKIEPVVEPGPAPRVNDTNKAFDIIVVAAAEGATPTPDSIAVGIFNHADRDLTIEINKRTIKLGSRHYVQVKLPREFGWREKDGPQQTTKVPMDSAGVEIVFRR